MASNALFNANKRRLPKNIAEWMRDCCRERNAWNLVGKFISFNVHDIGGCVAFSHFCTRNEFQKKPTLSLLPSNWFSICTIRFFLWPTFLFEKRYNIFRLDMQIFARPTVDVCAKRDGNHIKKIAVIVDTVVNRGDYMPGQTQTRRFESMENIFRKTIDWK